MLQGTCRNPGRRSELKAWRPLGMYGLGSFWPSINNWWEMPTVGGVRNQIYRVSTTTCNLSGGRQLSCRGGSWVAFKAFLRWTAFLSHFHILTETMLNLPIYIRMLSEYTECLLIKFCRYLFLYKVFENITIHSVYTVLWNNKHTNTWKLTLGLWFVPLLMCCSAVLSCVGTCWTSLLHCLNKRWQCLVAVYLRYCQPV